MPYERSHGRQCIVTGCFYTEKDRYFLLNAKCAHQKLRKDCGCETVFKFHKFPINPVVRKVWVENVNRKDVNEENSRKRQFVVCTNHFIDGQPTKENPYPTLYMQEPCPNPKFVAELNYDAAPPAQVQKPGNLVKDVQYVVMKLCNIICKDEEVTEEPSNHTDNVTSVDPPEDSLSARRDRRTIKKTYKARTFETQKLFNRIRFGRPENRSLLLSILRKTIDLPEVKDCSVKLHKLQVDSTVKLSEWEDYPLHCKESALDFDIKLDSDGSFTEELPTRDHVVIKTEEDDYDTLPELEFEVDNEYCVKELTESLSDVPEHDPIVEDDLLASPPQKKARILASPENGQKNSVNLTASPKFKNPVRIQFTARKQTAAKRPTPLSASGKLKLGEPKKVVKFSITTPKITSGNSRVEKAQVSVTPQVNSMPAKNFYDKKTAKAPVIATPSKTASEKSKAEIQSKTINPQSKIGPARALPKQLKTKQVEKNETTLSTVQPFKISHSKHKGSVKHSANIKVIRTYSNEKDLKNNNKKRNDQSSVLPKQRETEDSEIERISVSSSAENDTGKNTTSKTLPKSNVKLNNPPAISKIWTELHTHYDYTEEEEVPFSELPEIDDLTSYVVYEGEESDLSDDDDDEEEEEEVGNELCLTDTLTEEKCFAFTGLSLLVFRGLFGILKECAPKQSATVNLSVNDQMLLALMKLKLGLINTDLSVKFNTTPSTCGKVFSQWLSVMYKTLNHMVVWKSRETLVQEMPELFKEHSSLASCLIDIGQIFVKLSQHQNQDGQQDGISSASARKFLYAVSPDGFVIFLSQLFEENVSDAQMFADCGIMNKFETGDTIFVNSNFTDGVTLPSDITFDVLPHTKEGTEDQPLRLLSKKAVDMLKIFRILRGVITVPLSSAPHIIHTCAALSNLGLIR